LHAADVRAGGWAVGGSAEAWRTCLCGVMASRPARVRARCRAPPPTAAHTLLRVCLTLARCWALSRATRPTRKANKVMVSSSNSSSSNNNNSPGPSQARSLHRRPSTARTTRSALSCTSSRLNGGGTSATETSGKSSVPRCGCVSCALAVRLHASLGLASVLTTATRAGSHSAARGRASFL
jgi:hypothetical protein